METVRAADRDRYLSILYAPKNKRPSLFALYAFNAEIAAVRDRIREPMPGEIRLQWWRDAIAGDNAQGHPLAEALLEAIRMHRLPRKTFEDYLEARVFDLYDDPMPDRNALEGYCGETASALIQLAALVLDPQAAPLAADAAGHAGCGQAITGLLRLLPQHRARGQCFVPRDILAAAGTTPQEFVAGDGGRGAERAVTAMIALARDHLSAFERSVREVPASLRPAFLPVALSGPYLDLMEKPSSSPLRAAARLPEWRRHWLLFNRARNGWR
jgi:15-cis-phytoene synthase